MRFIKRLRTLLPERILQEPQRAIEDEHAFPTIIVSEQVCEATTRGLRSHGPQDTDHEGVVIWAGVTLENVGAKFVTSCIVPEADTSPGSFDITPAADARVVQAINEYDIHGIGLLHSHPGPNTDHSRGDEKDAGLVFDGYYSIVVPNYARDGVRPFTQCGVHRYEQGRFHRLSDDTVKQQFVTIPSSPTYIDTSAQ
jgi:proteasome lid subunit RPN8/RPN11